MDILHSKTSSVAREFFRRLRLHSLTALVGLIAPFITGSAEPKAPPRLLLPGMTASGTSIGGPLRALVPQRLMRVNPDLRTHAGDWLTAGKRIRLDLLENQDVTVELTHVTKAEDGALEITGTLANLPDGRVHLVLAGDDLSGLARVPGLGVFQWIPGVTGTSTLTRLPSCHAGWCATPEGPPMLPPESANLPGGGAIRHAQEAGRWHPGMALNELDIAVMYSAETLAAHGSESSLRQAIHGMVASANRSYTNSLIGVHLNPVFIGLHNTWRESGNMLTDFNAMFTDDRLRDLRNDYKADLVYLIIESDSNAYGGAATFLTNSLGDPFRSRSIFRRNVLFGNPRWSDFESVGFTHETGHMLGAGHDREHGYPSPFQGEQAMFPYANAHRFEAGGITYRTAMSYDPGIQLSLFSNPDLNFAGVPLGVPVGQPGEADNARVMNLMAPKVAAYRTALSRIGFAEPVTLAGE